MTTTSRSSFAALAALLVSPFAAAQADGPPKPAPELQKLASFVGSFHGGGTAVFDPSQGPTKWESHSTYRWCLDDHWLQEDTLVTFEGMPQPLVMRSYLGWDRESKRYVAVIVSNDGTVKVQEFQLTPDGAMVQIAMEQQEGTRYAMRMRSKPEGENVAFSMTCLMPEGESSEMVTGTMKKGAKEQPVAAEASAFMTSPSEPMKKVARMAGTYSVQGTMTMLPGTPAMKMTGKDTVAPLYDGTVLHVHGTGECAEMPGKYESHGFLAWNPTRECFDWVAVSNMGEVMEMQGHLSEDGKSLISMCTAKWMGNLTSSRFVLELDANGAMTGGNGTSLVGSHPAYECFRATYSKAK